MLQTCVSSVDDGGVFHHLRVVGNHKAGVMAHNRCINGQIDRTLATSRFAHSAPLLFGCMQLKLYYHMNIHCLSAITPMAPSVYTVQSMFSFDRE